MATTMKLCDDDGMTDFGVVPRQPWLSTHKPKYPCTGSVHIGTQEVVCTNPIHDKSVRRCCDHDLTRGLCPCPEHEVSGLHIAGRL